METEFTPFLSLSGGMLIGVAALIMMAFLGRIAGVSGLLGRLIPPNTASGDVQRISLGFVAGMLLAGVLSLVMNLPVEQHVSPNLGLLGVAGLLVGFGTAIGSGCTSGHGVCGLSRLSVRSLVATAVFLTAAAVTVFVVRHLVGGVA